MKHCWAIPTKKVNTREKVKKEHILHCVVVFFSDFFQDNRIPELRCLCGMLQDFVEQIHSSGFKSRIHLLLSRRLRANINPICTKNPPKSPISKYKISKEQEQCIYLCKRLLQTLAAMSATTKSRTCGSLVFSAINPKYLILMPAWCISSESALLSAGSTSYRTK